ncbi:MAG: dTDP-4-dehydrorhamnose reductase [Clostridiales bacterium]|jgi:dTDP-4-dehydrorhamnose reductase|nr:dTDP-4-dehydrorhamnose reductase [Clostridiales bacterium]
MKILITGANGQLGRELQYQLRGDCFEVIGCDLPELDVSRLDEFCGLVTANRPNVIINCAAYTNVDKCETDGDTAYAVNAIGARNAAMAANDVGAKLIHLSTDYVFNGAGSTSQREWDIPSPCGVYGFTKLMGERYAQTFCKRVFVVRTAWLYGYHGRNFVKAILSAARRGAPLKVVNDQIGNPTNAADLASHLIKLAHTEGYGVYHCVNGGECSWYDFAREFLSLSGLDYSITPCGTEEFPRPAKRPAYSSLDNMMLRLTIGDGMRHWKDAIADYMSRYNKCTGEFES